MSGAPLAALEQRDEFLHRHIGPGAADATAMLAAVGAASLDELIGQTVPASIRLAQPLALGEPLREHEALARLKAIAAKNVVKKSFIGLGYYDTLLPLVIQRNLLENPGWYTAYTPYQAEIAQGRLEALLNFQQMVIDLTGLPLANASLLDEATAAAEAMAMARRVSKSKANAFFVDAACFPQTLDVLRTRAAGFGFELVVAPAAEAADREVFGALLQYPNAEGECADFSELIGRLKTSGAVTALACDLMALVLLKPPGAMGADIALGSAQRFGVPMGYGGPHAAFFACRDEHRRAVPGRIIGVSVDARGKPALRMALQTREQHIRREKANSNICTSQVLLANIAGLYAVYHGPRGLQLIARRIHRLAGILAEGLKAAGVRVRTRAYFDTLIVETAAEVPGCNLRVVAEGVRGISLDEKTTREDVARLLEALTGRQADIDALDAQAAANDPLAGLLRADAILGHPVFNSHHGEHQMLRYLRKLQNRDLALDHSMIPLGSCTMKLNATAEMVPITWPEFAGLHPFAPTDQAAGYAELIDGLAGWLKAITGFDAICLQPNSGAQGEYAGLVTIRRYQAAQGEAHRDVCLIPKSAHGTNPATAQMCGLAVVTVDCDENGNVAIADLAAKAKQHAARLSCLMLTYPSTHGVFEEAVREICDIVHRHGGQVYMDGANLNAQVGLTSPAAIGADVSHMNLHKTFAIPHGGGGPGMGPIGLKAHLAPHAPGHIFAPAHPGAVPGHVFAPVQRGVESRQPVAESQAGPQGAVSAAPFGSASILPISWMYIALLGGEGLRRASEMAILNANYVAARLKDHYPVLYTGRGGRVAHECILDIRAIKAASGVSEIDIAKRLMDYGFHAPTVSFPVAGTIMIEPTESEPKDELDRFVEALISIREEIRRVERGEWPAEDNPLKRAPHTQTDLAEEEWSRPYTRRQAVFPLPWVAQNKFWPAVNRIDDVHGDRNLFCACPPPESYE
ncbi:MAG TPA: aminomethyl-transferring glycine dehydrogenase [Candidatus Desulfobacillus sp.]|mgnify:CR=1 FL=1|nr:aminomethyl-transferring glycine dehydrogenase [Candidatus Desulfobacillus sp.]